MCGAQRLFFLFLWFIFHGHGHTVKRQEIIGRGGWIKKKKKEISSFPLRGFLAQSPFFCMFMRMAGQEKELIIHSVEPQTSASVSTLPCLSPQCGRKWLRALCLLFSQRLCWLTHDRSTHKQIKDRKVRPVNACQLNRCENLNSFLSPSLTHA